MTYHAQTRPTGIIARCLAAIVCRRAPDQVIADEGCDLSKQHTAHKPAPVGTTEIDLERERDAWHLSNKLGMAEGLPFPLPGDGRSHVYINRWVLWSSGFSWRFWRKQDRMSDASRHGARLLLHEVLRADADMRPHNHPWDWAFALVISGGYAEVRLTDFSGVRLVTKWRWPWRLYRLSGTDFHRISNLKERASWSLFLHGPRRHGWGFIEALPADDGSACWGARFEPFDPDRTLQTP